VSGSALVTGQTTSSGWTSGGWDTSYGGSMDGFVVKINPFSPGDADGDGKVDGADLAIWQQHYDPLGNNPDNNFSTGDWNDDGKIDGGDLALWQQKYNPLGV